MVELPVMVMRKIKDLSISKEVVFGGIMERYGVLKAYGGISEGYVTKLKRSAQVSSGEGQEDNQDWSN